MGDEHSRAKVGGGMMIHGIWNFDKAHGIVFDLAGQADERVHFLQGEIQCFAAIGEYPGDQREKLGRLQAGEHIVVEGSEHLGLTADAVEVVIVVAHAHEGDGGLAIHVVVAGGEVELAIRDGLFEREVHAPNEVDVAGNFIKIEHKVVLWCDPEIGLEVGDDGFDATPGTVEVFAVTKGGINAPLGNAVGGHIHHVHPEVAWDGEDDHLRLDKIDAHQADGVGLGVFIDAEHEHQQRGRPTTERRLGGWLGKGGGCLGGRREGEGGRDGEGKSRRGCGAGEGGEEVFQQEGQLGGRGKSLPPGVRGLRAGGGFGRCAQDERLPALGVAGGETYQDESQRKQNDVFALDWAG